MEKNEYLEVTAGRPAERAMSLLCLVGLHRVLPSYTGESLDSRRCIRASLIGGLWAYRHTCRRAGCSKVEWRCECGRSWKGDGEEPEQYGSGHGHCHHAGCR